MVEHVAGIDTEFQALAFCDSNRLTQRCIEQPESWAFHRIQSKSTSFAWKRIPEDDHDWLTVRKLDRQICRHGLPCGYWPRECLKRAARGGTSIEILQGRDTSALRV